MNLIETDLTTIREPTLQELIQGMEFRLKDNIEKGDWKVWANELPLEKIVESLESNIIKIVDNVNSENYAKINNETRNHIYDAANFLMFLIERMRMKKYE